jgi:Coenzyme PQQ synthesis protein D (PqqD)
MTLSAGFRISSPKVVHEVFDDEVVIINLDTGTYYSVEGVAAEIWTRIDGTAVTEILDDLTARYSGAGEQEIAPAVMRFLDELRSEGLIVPAETGREKAAAESHPIRPAPAGGGQFQAPVLRKFDDMQELLLLDPIHDFDDAGWPVTKPARAVEK